MASLNIKPLYYLYHYSCHEDEVDLCQLEMRSLFGFHTHLRQLKSNIEVTPSRSPFMKERIDVFYEEKTLEGLLDKVKRLEVAGVTFKVSYIKNRGEMDKVTFEERRNIERNIGVQIRGTVDLQKPELLFAVIRGEEHWIFGQYVKSEPIWLKHQQKPHQYSTALSTRVARAVVNIAAPNTSTVKVIDPCCGIGTVLIEGLSMGIEMIGRDVNPLVMKGVRENIAFFGYECEVTLGDMRDVVGKYDVAIIDLPYNLCSVNEPKVQLEMLQKARHFAKKMVVVTVEPIDAIIKKAGFTIVDRCIAKKSSFTREIIVCV